ncbi:MAG: HEAT repeat domain-containing protein [Phycisphaeraceae bacterium]
MSIRLHHPLTHRTLALAALLAAALLSGCQSSGSDDESILAPLLKQIDLVPMSPGQAARDAFNRYDADKRRNGVSMLSASPFGGQTPYVNMYRLRANDPDATVRAAAIKALGLHGNTQDMPIFLHYLDAVVEPVSFVRWESALALQKIHSDDAVAPLIKATQDLDADVRMAAATALGQYAQARVFQALIGVLDDADYGTVAAAHDSLVTLTGYDFGHDGSLWLIWAEKNQGKLFEHRQQYVWLPFQRPPRWYQRPMFWIDAPPPEPRVPVGMDGQG